MMEFAAAEKTTTERLALLQLAATLQMKREREIQEREALKAKIELNKTCINEFRYKPAAQALFEKSEQQWYVYLSDSLQGGTGDLGSCH